MANPSKRKGTGGENEARTGWRRWFPACERLALAGKSDRGDLSGVPYVVSVKRAESWPLHKWLAELAKMQANANGTHGLIQARRSRGRWVFILPEQTFVHLMDSVYGSPAPSNEERPTP